jgi:putative ABC transport system permease protein
VFKLGLRTVLAHRLRFVLCTVAVLLGAAFVSGSMIFTDTLSASLDSQIASTTADLTVTATSALERPSDSLGTSDARPRLLPLGLVDRLSRVPGVDLVDGQLMISGVRLIGKDGQPYATGRPMFGASWPHEARTATFTVTEGDAPWGRLQLTLDRKTAQRAGYAVGDRVRLVTATHVVTARLVGLTSTATSGAAAGSPLVAFDPAMAQLLLVGRSGWTSIAVTAKPGTDVGALRERLRAAAGPDARVRTASEAVDEAKSAIDDVFGTASSVLAMFAGLALFTGCFLIFNTFAVLVTQRVRELGLLRAVGASRSQVTRSVLAEALVIGVAGSTAGLLIGAGLVAGLRAILQAADLALPDAGLRVSASTVIWCYVIGVGITAMSAYLPARRAGRLAPVDALRDDVAQAHRSLLLRVIFGLVALITAAIGYASGISAKGLPGALIVGLSTGIALVAAVMLSPALARPAVLALTWPVRRRPTVLLGANNARRNPRRTSATASALMIALAVISLLAVLASSAKASIDKGVRDAFGTADFVITGSDGRPFPDEVANKVARTDGVAEVGRLRSMTVKVGANLVSATGVDPGVLRGPIVANVERGSLDPLDAGLALLPANLARTLEADVGDTITVITRSGRHKLAVAAVLAPNTQLNAIVVSLVTFGRIGGGVSDSALYVDLDDGVQPAEAAPRLAATVAENPLLQVRDQTAYAQAQRGPVDALAGAVYALLALAVVIAILGVVNTLLLSVFERTREIGLLRAIGMERDQVRSMVRVESIAIAVLGAVLGLVIGVTSAAAIQSAMTDDGFAVLDIPYLQLLIVVLAAALVGVLAALWPARRAARLDILRAITTE